MLIREEKKEYKIKWENENFTIIFWIIQMAFSLCSNIFIWRLLAKNHISFGRCSKLPNNFYGLRTSTYIFTESDNFGSTDSEVKKILTLHLPISEYDTLGSDSEYDGRQSNNQELVSFRHIGPSRGKNMLIFMCKFFPNFFHIVRVVLVCRRRIKFIVWSFTNWC